MLNDQLFFKKLLLMSAGVVMMMILVTAAKADDQVTRRHTFDLGRIDAVAFSNSVGKIEVVPASGDEMRVTVEIEAKEHGFFRRRVDVDDMDIEIRERGDTLYLSFDAEHVSAEWLVEMPTVGRATVEMGVGELRLDVGETELDVTLGVGDVNIRAPESAVGRINLDVGVGDASLRGGEVIRKERAFISRSIRGEGNGSRDMRVDLGVGDVSVNLE